MPGRYDRIDRAVYLYHGTEQTMWLLTGEGCEENGLEVDLESDCDFNCGFPVLSRTTVTAVSSLSDVLAFCREHKLDAPFRHYDNSSHILLVGGEKDCAVQEDLAFDWVEPDLEQETAGRE